MEENKVRLHYLKKALIAADIVIRQMDRAGIHSIDVKYFQQQVEALINGYTYDQLEQLSFKQL